MNDELDKLRRMGDLASRIADNIVLLPLMAELDEHLRIVAGKRGCRRGTERHDR